MRCAREEENANEMSTGTTSVAVHAAEHDTSQCKCCISMYVCTRSPSSAVIVLLRLMQVMLVGGALQQLNISSCHYTATSQRMHRCVLPHISHSQLIDYMPFYKQRSCYLGVFAFCIYAQCDVIVGSQSLFKTQCTSDRDISCSDGKGGSGFVRFLLEFSTRVVFIALLISEKD